MPDPQVLYIVTAVVVLALVAWVVVVLSRPVDTLKEEMAKPAAAPESGKAPSHPPPKPSQRPVRLDSHAEIRDDEATAAKAAAAAAEVPVDVEEEEEPTGPNA